MNGYDSGIFRESFMPNFILICINLFNNSKRSLSSWNYVLSRRLNFTRILFQKKQTSQEESLFSQDSFDVLIEAMEEQQKTRTSGWRSQVTKR
jgi:hypothetical protein